MKQESAPKHTMERLANHFNGYRKGYYFPSDDIDPKEKKGAWCLAFQQALWGLYTTGGCYNSPSEYADLQRKRLYGAGKQPNGQYMDWTIGDEQTNPLRQGFMSTNWQIFSPMSLFKRRIRGMMGKHDYMAVANAVDPTSQAKKEEEKWNIWYDSEYGAKEQEIMQAVTGLANEELKAKYVAKSLEELEMFNEIGGIKLRTEVEIENLLDATDYVSNIKKIKEKVIDDLTDFGKAAFRDYFDPISGLVKKEYVDWENLIIDYSNETDFNDIRFWSYVKFETINNVRVRSGLTEAEIIEIALLNCGFWGNMDKGSFNQYKNQGYKKNGVRMYNQFRVPVLISEWISTDTEYKVAKKKNGGTSYFEQEHGKEYDTPTKQTKVTTANNVYNSTWIIGSKFVYDDGLSPNIARPDPKNPKLSIHAQILPGQSITESIIPNLDQLALTWFKWQSAMAQAHPNGTDWDLTQLEGIDLGGGLMKPLALIALKRQTGDSFRRTVNLQGNYANQGKAANQNEGGIGGFLEEILTTMEAQFKYISDLTGIDLITGGGMTSETTATEIKRDASITNDALQPLFNAWVEMQEDAGQTVANKVQRAIRLHPQAKEAYEGILGKTGAKILSLTADTTAAEFGIKIELKSTEQMVAFAIEAVMESIKVGANGGPGISGADGYFFVDMIQRGRTKQAMALFNYRVNKVKQEQAKMQEENMKQNRQTMIEAQKEKNAGEMDKIAAQGQIDLKQEAVKALLQMNVDGNAHLLELKRMYVEQILTPPEPAPVKAAA